MYLSRSKFRFVAGSFVLLAATVTQAALITYSTTGTFSGGDTPGTSTFTDTADGISIGFDGTFANTVTAPPTSFVAFGTFDTLSTTGTGSTPVSSTFTLSITQTTPTSGTTSIVGTLQGSLMVTNSQAYVQFSNPYQTSIGSVFYTLLVDNFGRVLITPPDANFGLATLNGAVSSVPEPTTLSVIAVGATALLRRKRRI